MAKMKSIRLDFPAEGISIKNEEIAHLIAAALMAGTDKATKKGKPVLKAAAMAARSANVDEYDNRFGSPVFYVP
jgi:hypothetical protein